MPDHPTPSSHLPIDQLKAILFDLDGTLIDTDDQVVDRLAARLRPFLGRSARSVARWLLMKAETPGNAFVTMLDVIGLDKPLMSFTDRLRRRRGVYAAHSFQLIPGVQQMLPRLKQAGFKLGIVTSRSRYHIGLFMEQFPQLARAIEATCGLQDTRRLKPHPSPILLAAERLGVEPESCLMVGDTMVDVQSARRAHVWSAAVLCGFGERDELEQAGAHVILASTADLAHLLLSDPQTGS
jgi:HAD superfamily hydrolase (TIGR01509 family)